MNKFNKDNKDKLKKNILITGGRGFIGKNLVSKLQEIGYENLFFFNREDSLELLKKNIKKVDFIFHFASTIIDKNEDNFYKINIDLTEFILNELSKQKRDIPILFTSTIHAGEKTPYGISKLEAEKKFLNYNKKTNKQIIIYKLSHVFGRWAKPNYNSVISTWCYNVNRDIEIKIFNKKQKLDLIYIDDLIDSFIKKLNEPEKYEEENYFKMDIVYERSLKEISDLLYKFREIQKNKLIYETKNKFEKALLNTYNSYSVENN